jgi:hypothetical protein
MWMTYAELERRAYIEGNLELVSALQQRGVGGAELLFHFPPAPLVNLSKGLPNAPLRPNSSKNRNSR